jgi:hypothetical protein
MFNTWTNLGEFGAVDYCAQYLPQIYAAADRYGIDRGIALAQIKQESNCDPSRCSYKGACGIAQFMPATWAQYTGGGGTPRTDVSTSLDAWGRFMRDLLSKYNGDYSLALAAYNAGPKRVDDFGGVPPPSFAKGQTYNYVQIIMKALGLGGSADTGSTTTTGTTGSTGGDTGSAGGDWWSPAPGGGSSIDFTFALPQIALVSGLALAAWLFLR